MVGIALLLTGCGTGSNTPQPAPPPQYAYVPPATTSQEALFPPTVGQYQRKGEVSSTPVPSAEQFQAGALRPTANSSAEYSFAKTLLTMQIVQYETPGAANTALSSMRENHERLNTQAKVGVAPTSSHAAPGAAGTRVSVQDPKSGQDQLLWTRGARLHVLSGGKLATLVAFEDALPEP